MKKTMIVAFLGFLAYSCVSKKNLSNPKYTLIEDLKNPLPQINDSLYNSFLNDTISFSIFQIIQIDPGVNDFESCKYTLTPDQIEQLKLSVNEIKRGNYIVITDDVKSSSVRLLILKKGKEILFSLSTDYSIDLLDVLENSEDSYWTNLKLARCLYDHCGW